MDSDAAVQSVCKTFCTSFYKSLRAAKYMPVKASAPPPPLPPLAFFFVAIPPQPAVSLPQTLGDALLRLNEYLSPAPFRQRGRCNILP